LDAYHARHRILFPAWLVTNEEEIAA